MSNINLIFKLEKIVKKYHKNALISMVPETMNGHFATNLLFLNKECKNELLNDLQEYIESFEECGYFLNFILKSCYIESLEFDCNFGQNKEINLEYCSPNPTGPIHLGHCRNIAVGKTMDNLLRYCNYKVQTELYMNDYGNQINEFVNTIQYWQDIKNYGKSDLEPKYHGEYMKELANNHTVDNIVNFQVNQTIDKIKSLGLTYDRITKETSLNMEPVLHQLYEKNLVEEKDGKLYVGDKVIRRTDGTYTYFGHDICYHLYKKTSKQLIVLGEDQRGNFSHLQLLLKHFNIDLHIILIGTVHAKENNELITMSKRKGTFVEIDDILKKMSIGQLICSLLDANLHKSIIIDINQPFMENTMFYIEYINSLINNIELHNSNLTQEEHKILGMMILWPKSIYDSVNYYDPHKAFIFIKQIISLVYLYLSKNNTCHIYIHRSLTQILTGINQIIHSKI